MWIAFLIIVVPGFLSFALGFVARVFWIMTALCVVALIAIPMMNGWTRASCRFGDEQACLALNFGDYAIEGMTAERVRHRQDDYYRFPAADRNQPLRRWSMLRTEMLNGVNYTTRQQCFGALWPEVGSLWSFKAFEHQCFDRQVISPGEQSGAFLPPAEDFVDMPDLGFGSHRRYPHGDTVAMQEIREGWNKAIGMFDRSAAGEAPID